MKRAAPVALALVLALAGSAGAVSPGELDDFGASIEGWQRGTRTTPGQGGATDFYLRLTSDGIGPTGRLVTFNQAQWTGDYTGARVRSISMAVNNLGPTDLQLRLAFGDSAAPLSGGSWFVSASPVFVPAGSGWITATFPIECANLTRTRGTKTCAQLLSGVTTLRLLHSALPGDQGDPITAVLGVDRISAPVEVPVFPTD